MITNGQSFLALEKIPTRTFPHARDVSKAVARRIAELIRSRAAEGRRCVLGLATGSTPVGVYDELIRLHREEQLSFANVVKVTAHYVGEASAEDLHQNLEIRHSHYARPGPASTGLRVTSLLNPDALIAIAVIATR